MAKNKILEATNGIVAILDPLNSEERTRVIQAAMTVLGEQRLPDPAAMGGGGALGGGAGNGGGDAKTPKAYFDLKDPKTKGEELATAGRYREQRQGADASTQDELKAVIKLARRNFDASNYRRDLDNAQTKGLFNRGTGKDSVVLSHYGQNYVDALPDREAVKKLRKPRRASAKKKKTKKKARRA